MILQDQGSRPVVWASSFQRIGRRPKDRDFCWSCPFKSAKSKKPGSSQLQLQTQHKLNGEDFLKDFHKNKYIPSIIQKIQKGQDLKNTFLEKKTAVSNLQKKNSWFLGWRFIPNINTVPTLQGPQLPRVTTCEAMVVTRIPGSQRLVGCYLTLSKSVLLGRANKVLTCFFSQQPTCNSYTIRTTLNTCPATKGHQSSKIKELETSTT